MMSDDVLQIVPRGRASNFSRIKNYLEIYGIQTTQGGYMKRPHIYKIHEKQRAVIESIPEQVADFPGWGRRGTSVQ